MFDAFQNFADVVNLWDIAETIIEENNTDDFCCMGGTAVHKGFFSVFQIPDVENRLQYIAVECPFMVINYFPKLTKTSKKCSIFMGKRNVPHF